jgi:hypothetical protein
MVILCTGVIIAGSTFHGFAASYDVTATVHAPIPTNPALITTPYDQQHVSQPEVQVAGTCPADTYVKLFRNAAFSGVSQCIDATFRILTSLVPGENRLEVKVYNVTDDEGPASAPISVYYDETVAAPALPKNTPAALIVPPSKTVAPVAILVDYHYQSHKYDEAFTWDLGITGGVPPYVVTIDWSDGSKSEIASGAGALFSVTHIFPGAGPYQPLVRATDKDGDSATLQLSAVAWGVAANPVFTPNNNPADSFFAWFKQYVWLVWPVYGAVVLMAASFWLGELEVFHKISEKQSRTRHNAPRKNGRLKGA